MKSFNLRAEVVQASFWPIASGIAIGMAGGLASTRVFASMLFGTQPTDPATFAVTMTMLALTALLAAWIPARRAARIDPVTALRAE